MGKSGKSLSCQVGLAMEQAEFWKQRVQNYIADAPGELQHRSTIEDYMTAVGTCVLDKEGLEKLKRIVNGVQDLQSVVRPSSLEQLSKNVLASLKDLSGAFMEKKEEPGWLELSTAEALQELVADASILFPMEVWLASTRADVGKTLKDSVVTVSLSRCKALCKKILANQKKAADDKDAIWPVVVSLGGMKFEPSWGELKEDDLKLMSS
eukprot:6455852-Amphidinium_carterae.1